MITSDNVDRTPSGVPNNTNQDVAYVSANDKGIFYAVLDGKKLKFYQIGKYTNEYNPETVSPTVSSEWTNGISFYSQGEFHDAGLKALYNLDPGVIYRADKSIRLKMVDLSENSSLGVLSITKDSLFSVDADGHPILLKGQMTANFNSPAKVYAIKFDRFDLNLFQEKLDQFIAGNLPATEFFIIKNIHTKFTVKNQSNNVNVAVDTGEVQVLSRGLEKSVTAGKQVSIDGKNNVKESVYFAGKFYLIAFGVLVFVAVILLFRYRKTPVGKKILQILKTVLVWTWIIIKKVLSLIWKGLKFLGQLIIKLIKKKK